MDKLIQQLNVLDADERQAALQALVAAWRAGNIKVAPQGEQFNMHSHTFFSYNGYGLSPSGLAWLARASRWEAFAKVDFDVLDGIDEALDAADQVGVRAAAGVETRLYLSEMADWEFNSPGEPGVLYFVGMGFGSEEVPDGAKPAVYEMRDRAAARNEGMVERLNAYLDPVVIDYQRDVLPLTPSGNATERHILVAYDVAARARFADREALLAYWADKLSLTPDAVGAFMGDEPYPHDAIRSRLMKRGGVGYVQPSADTFPALEDVNAAMIACGAVTSYAFLNGESEGEQHLEELFDLLMAQGMASLTVIPDRNWNYDDSAVRATKVAKLDACMALAQRLDLPVIVGTEMNKPGQRQMDDFDAEPLKPYWDVFQDGMRFIYGHTFMQRTQGKGFHCGWAQSALPKRADRNAFYTRVGELATPGKELLTLAQAWDSDREPGWYLSQLARQT